MSSLASEDGTPPRDGQGKFMISPESLERDAQAARLRASGWSATRVSNHLGYGSRQNVDRAVRRAMDRIIVPAIEEARKLMLDSIAEQAETLLEIQQAAIADGDLTVWLRSVDQFGKLDDRKARLLGLFAPDKILNLNGRGEPEVPPALVENARKIEEQAAKEEAELNGRSD